MVKTLELSRSEATEIDSIAQSFSNQRDGYHQGAHPGRPRLLNQILRFSLVGVFNTLVDLLILNGLLVLFPTSSTVHLLAYNSLAYSVGAVNSFLLNKYWTFGKRQRTTRGELLRFMLTTVCGIGWSSVILWIASNVLHPLLVNATVWANVSKIIAIGGTSLISYLGMRLWVFVNKAQEEQTVSTNSVSSDIYIFAHEQGLLPETMAEAAALEREPGYANEDADRPINGHSLSVVLPAYNEEEIIASTVSHVLDVLSAWQLDFEVLVVNDGSLDRTGEIVAALAEAHPRLHLITHSVNAGYGAALVSGFAAATKELTFFMDSDGQFDIRDLRQFFPLIDENDAVLGYRIDRQDAWMRKLNARGWKYLIGWVLAVHVRDVDCAFKLLHTEFLHQHPLETRGAMINAELLYRLAQAGCSYREIGVQHLPRLGGRATGAKPTVILRALRELFVSARKWRREEQMRTVSARTLHQASMRKRA